MRTRSPPATPEFGFHPAAYPHVPGEEQVGQGEVPVHDAVAVQVQQPGHHLGQQVVNIVR